MPYVTYRHLRAMNGWFSKGELAKKLGVDPGVIERLSERFPPSKLLGANACWTSEDATKIEDYLHNRKSAASRVAERVKDQVTALGLYSIKRAAAEFGVVKVTWEKAAQKGKVPKPSHRHGVYRYYTKDEAQQIAEQIKSRSVNQPPAGNYSVRQAAEMLKMNFRTVSDYCTKNGIGTLPTPRRRWLTMADIKELAKLIGVTL